MPPATRALVGLLAASLLVALPSMPASGSAAGARPSGDVPAVRAAGAIPVWATVGPQRPLAGAVAELVDGQGRVLARARTNARGTATLPRELAPRTFSVRVSGGTVAGKANDTTLVAAGLRRPAGAAEVVYVTPVTTIAAQVAARRGTDPAKAQASVMRALGFPAWVSQAQVGTVRGAFDPTAFAAFAARSGGPRAAIATLARRIDAGSTVPSLTLLDDEPSAGSQLRGRDLIGDAATSVGQQVMGKVVSAVKGKAEGVAMGVIFGSPVDPTAAALAEIASQLAEINAKLLQLQRQMETMLAAQAQGQFTTIAASMSMATMATTQQWRAYDFFVNSASPASPTYDATVQSFAEDFQRYLQPYVPLYGSLFSTAGSIGLLQAMYDAQGTAKPWWNQSDVDLMRSTVDYYGTLQAQATTLLVESWQFSSPTYAYSRTDEYVDSQLNGVFVEQSNDIYLSMPTSLVATEIAVPGSQRAYAMRPFTTQVATAATYALTTTMWSYSNAPTVCGMKEVVSFDKEYVAYKLKPPLIPASTVQGWWASTVPSGSTLADTSDFATLAKKRGSQTSLRAMQQGAPSAQLLVTKDSLPGVSVRNLSTTRGVPLLAFGGWLWCGDATVSMVGADADGWKVNPYFAPTKSVNELYAWPVGVLSYRSGTFGYVAPS